MVRHCPASQKLVVSHLYLQIGVVRALVSGGYALTTEYIKKGKTATKIFVRDRQESLRSVFHITIFQAY